MKTLPRAATLNDLLDEFGLPLSEVSDLSGVPTRTLLRLRAGEVARPRIATIAALARTLKLHAVTVRAAVEASAAKAT